MPTTNYKKFLSYEDAKKAVRAAGITTKREYDKKYRLISGLPSTMYLKNVYPEFEGFKSFLSEKKSKYATLDELKDFLQKNGIENISQYKLKYHASIKKLPCDPIKYYKVDASEIFSNIGTFDSFKKKTYGTLKQLKEFIKNNSISSLSEYWSKYKDSKVKFPYYPVYYYGKSSEELFSHEENESYMPLCQLKKYVASKGIYDMDSLIEYTMKNSDPAIPEDIESEYHDDFDGWDNFFEKREVPEDKFDKKQCYDAICEMEKQLAILKTRLFKN